MKNDFGITTMLHELRIFCLYKILLKYVISKNLDIKIATEINK